LGQIVNDSTFRYEYDFQTPDRDIPVLIDAYHNTIYHHSRERAPATEAMVDILRKEMGSIQFIEDELSNNLFADYPEGLLIIKGLPNKRIAIDDELFYWKSPLSQSEVDAVVNWVAEGGKLMLFLSHFPNGSGGKPLLEAFSVKFRDGYIYHGNYRGESENSMCSWFSMSKENGMINGGHPAVKGTDLNVDTVRLLCGAAIFRNPEDVILAYPDKSANMMLRTDGSEFSSAEQSGQYAAMIGFGFGKGKVMVSGDQGLFRNNVLIDKETGQKTYITINDPKVDNPALLVNILRWLKE
jgi:hypothetical protein